MSVSRLLKCPVMGVRSPPWSEKCSPACGCTRTHPPAVATNYRGQKRTPPKVAVCGGLLQAKPQCDAWNTLRGVAPRVAVVNPKPKRGDRRINSGCPMKRASRVPENKPCADDAAADARRRNIAAMIRYIFFSSWWCVPGWYFVRSLAFLS